MINLRRSILVLLLASFAVFSAAAPPVTQASFDALKSLVGQWEGKTNGDRPVSVSFKLTGGGSALLSEIEGKQEDMISMIHMDGPGRLLLTHYCAAGNQPRMQATVSSDGRVFTFNFVDATNLAHPDDGHMQSAVFTIIDANHHTEEWTYADHGKEAKELFDLHRK